MRVTSKRIVKSIKGARAPSSDPGQSREGALSACCHLLTPSRQIADSERDHGKSRDGLCVPAIEERTLGHFPAINSAAFSAMAMIGKLVFPLITVGISEPSITRRLSMPRTRSLLSTTASRSSPMRHVPTGW